MGEVNGIIYDRLNLLNEYTRDLLEYQNIDLESLSENKLTLRAVERTLQIALETCIDIGQRLIATAGFRKPDSSRGVFEVLAEEKIVPKELLPNLQKMAGFRNLLVHGYAQVDVEKVHEILKNDLEDFDRFAKAVVGYLEAGN